MTQINNNSIDYRSYFKMITIIFLLFSAIINFIYYYIIFLANLINILFLWAIIFNIICSIIIIYALFKLFNKHVVFSRLNDKYQNTEYVIERKRNALFKRERKIEDEFVKEDNKTVS